MTHEELKQKALERSGVAKAYQDLELEFHLLEDMLRAREQTGLTQSQIAEKMGTKQAAITRLESALSNGTHSPSLRTLKRYAQALGYQLDIRLKPHAKVVS